MLAQLFTAFLEERGREDNEEKDEGYSPLDDPRLADIPEPDELPAMDKDLPYYVEPSDKGYEVPITQGMLDFTIDLL